MAGVIPGLMIGAMMMIATYFLAKKVVSKGGQKPIFKEQFTAFKEAFGLY